MSLGAGLIPRLEALYDNIDECYRNTAQKVGFSCDGCDGVRCCTVDLILHTFVEKHYLRRGFNTLDMSLQLEILGRSRAVLKAKERDPHGDAYRNAVCVLNFDGRCVLYHYRPMICRLAGIRHLLLRPDGARKVGEGCRRFRAEIEPVHPDAQIDRTRFYREMAALEIEMVRTLGRRTVSRTLAETLGAEHPEEELP